MTYLFTDSITPGKPRTKSLAHYYNHHPVSDSATTESADADAWSLKSSYSAEELETLSISSSISVSSSVKSTSQYSETECKTASSRKRAANNRKIKRLNPDSLALWQECFKRNEESEDERFKESVATVVNFIKLYPVN